MIEKNLRREIQIPLPKIPLLCFHASKIGDNTEKNFVRSGNGIYA